jgi:acyl-CoA-binding protein
MHLKIRRYNLLILKFYAMKNKFRFLHKKSTSMTLMVLFALFAACEKGDDADETKVSNL